MAARRPPVRHRVQLRPTPRRAAIRLDRQSPRRVRADPLPQSHRSCQRIALRQIFVGHAENARKLVERRSSFGQSARLGLFRAVAKDAQRKGLLHHLAHPLLRLHGSHLEERGAGREHFNQREAQSAHLILHGLLDGPRGLHDLLGVAQARRARCRPAPPAWPATR